MLASACLYSEFVYIPLLKLHSTKRHSTSETENSYAAFPDEMHNMELQGQVIGIHNFFSIKVEFGCHYDLCVMLMSLNFIIIWGHLNSEAVSSYARLPDGNPQYQSPRL